MHRYGTTHMARQVWGPDIDFLNPEDLIKLSKDPFPLESALEELTDLCLLCSRSAWLISRRETLI